MTITKGITPKQSRIKSNKPLLYTADVMQNNRIVFFIDTERAPLQSNTERFYVKFSQYSYLYLHLCTIFTILYCYGRFTVGFLI